jgi:hypothetical protein
MPSLWWYREYLRRRLTWKTLGQPLLLAALGLAIVGVMYMRGRERKREAGAPGTYQVVRSSERQGERQPRPQPRQVTFPKPLLKMEHRLFNGAEPAPDEGETITFAVADPGLCDTAMTLIDKNTGKATKAPCDGTRDPSIESWKDDAPFLHAPDELVVPTRTLRIVVLYPLARTVSFDLEPESPRGFTRLELLARIGELYQYIYREERRTAPTPAKQITPGGNVSETAGTFGICCHDLHDLVLEGVQLTKGANGDAVAWLNIGS